MEERTMDVIEKFGNRVSSQALKDPEKARRLLLAGYRLQEKKLQFLPDRGLPSSGQYVARVVMKNIIPVSYTHLDVYKRQLLRLASATRLISFFNQIRPTSCIPVSYTHLMHDSIWLPDNHPLNLHAHQNG